LVADEAVHHCTCYALFTSHQSLIGQGQRRRPEDVEIRKAFDELCEWAEDSCELLTLDDRGGDYMEDGGTRPPRNFAWGTQTQVSPQ